MPASASFAKIRLAQPRVTVEQVFQIPVEEAIAPEAVKHRLQIEGHILQGDRSVFRNIQVVVHQLFIFLENLVDDVGLVAEVVIQITRRYRQVRGNVIGGDVALTLVIKQLQAG